jgi:predicted nuclease of restriction endonuclease-like (RecB) superfamily
MQQLSKGLTASHGRGWSTKQLRHCLRAAETFPEEQIVSAVRRLLNWTHIKTIMYVDDPLKREFYLELCALERWSSRRLQERMGTMLWERTALSRKPEETIRHELDRLRAEGELSPEMVLKDPYLLDFMGLNDRYLERDLEDAILREIEQFLLELGAGFTFVARQRRIQIDNDDFYLDLLFYHLRLRRYVVIELKARAFEPGDVGQINLYRAAVDDLLRHPDDQPTIGLLLCRGKNKLVVEYALSGLDKSIAVADWKKQITETLPAEFQGSLPTIAEIEAELGGKLKAPAKEEKP